MKRKIISTLFISFAVFAFTLLFFLNGQQLTSQYSDLVFSGTVPETPSYSAAKIPSNRTSATNSFSTKNPAAVSAFSNKNPLSRNLQRSTFDEESMSSQGEMATSSLSSISESSGSMLGIQGAVLVAGVSKYERVNSQTSANTHGFMSMQGKQLPGSSISQLDASSTNETADPGGEFDGGFPPALPVSGGFLFLLLLSFLYLLRRMCVK